jgi:hypothetical protein
MNEIQFSYGFEILNFLKWMRTILQQIVDAVSFSDWRPLQGDLKTSQVAIKVET